MQMMIQVHLFARAADEAELELVLAQMLGEHRRHFALFSPERYWKIETLYDVGLRTSLQATTPGDAIIETLQILERIATHWHIRTPGHLRDGTFQLEGDAERPEARVLALESVDFSLTGT
jgi:hypothetical protein